MPDDITTIMILLLQTREQVERKGNKDDITPEERNKLEKVDTTIRGSCLSVCIISARYGYDELRSFVRALFRNKNNFVNRDKR